MFQARLRSALRLGCSARYAPLACKCSINFPRCIQIIQQADKEKLAS